jgi:hypothetical protein
MAPASLRRAELASDGVWDAAWGDELEHRAGELDAGVVETVPAGDVFADARRRLASRQ